MDRKKIVIVDDHPIVREGMKAMFEMSGRFELAAILENGRDVIEWCRFNGLPDVVITDVRMPGLDGFALLERLRGEFPGAKVLMLAGLPNCAEEKRARAMGACGYMSKGANTLALANAVMRLAEGQGEFAADAYASARSPFTPREEEALGYFALGKTREETALIMGVGVETVKSYAKAIREKMDAANTAAAIARAYELGYLQ